MVKSIFDYFYFSQKERRGIFVLLSIILILIFSNAFVIPQMGKEDPIDKDAFIAWVDSLMPKPVDTIGTKPIEYFRFDPNQTSKEEWLKLGLSEDQIRVIQNYQKAGGKFFIKEDLKKIYSISETQYQKLEPYIIIQTPKKAKPKKLSQTKKIRIELNSADSTDLIKINGIGSVFSSRILKYRKLLGGYTHPSQILEVYGIDSAKFQKIKHCFTPCDSSKIVLLNINTSDFKVLLKHPYISYDFVKYIVNVRRVKQFDSVNDLKDQEFIPDSTFKKLLPYLKIK